ncbi:MAG: hypothetical protein VYB50_02090 [Candidatus Thermoplasmatota archaeon]|nr:hypothetical protein [Candidatus Thermoplasmatota archaeon]
MSKTELKETHDSVWAEHEEAKKEWAQAQTEEARNRVKAKYPDFESGHLPRTPSRIVYEAMKRYKDVETLTDSEIKYISKCEDVILNSPDGAEYAYHVASQIRQDVWEEAEECISGSAWWAYMYAAHVLKGPFQQGESMIMNHPVYGARYSKLLASITGA